MKLFQLNDEYSVVCVIESTRSGFRHLATLMQNGSEINKAKCCYSNRTWECFEFESVLQDLLGKNFSDEEVKGFLDVAGGRAKIEFDENMKTVGAIASLGEVFGQSKKESNDWKARMLKAGLPGLDIPADWDSLSEDERESRLDKVIAVTKEVRA